MITHNNNLTRHLKSSIITLSGFKGNALSQLKEPIINIWSHVYTNMTDNNYVYTFEAICLENNIEQFRSIKVLASGQDEAESILTKNFNVSTYRVTDVKPDTSHMIWNYYHMITYYYHMIMWSWTLNKLAHGPLWFGLRPGILHVSTKQGEWNKLFLLNSLMRIEFQKRLL